MRVKNSLFNMITAIVPTLIIGVLGFVKIRFFIQYLGSDANGLIQFIYRLLSYLTLIEMGFGAALVYKLYKPLAEKDYKKTSELMTTAHHFFKKIGFIILAFLVVFMLVLPFIINNNTYSSSFLYTIFLLAGIPYAIEYFWYKKYYILICSDQKQYKVNILYNASTIIYDIIIVFALMQGIDLITYVLLSYPFVFLKGIILNIIVKKNYKELHKTKKMDKEALALSKDVFIHNIGNLINNSTDQIILSIFNGLSFVSIYSAYYYIVKYLKDFTSAALNSTVHSFGNLFSSKDGDNKKSYSVFREYFSFSSYLSVIIAATFAISILPFIKIWIGIDSYLLSFWGVLSFVLLVYVNIIIAPLAVVVSADGLFKKTKYYSFISSVTNITLSLILIHKYEIAGIIFATVISKLLIWAPLTIKVIYQETFKGETKKDCYIEIIKSLLYLIIVVSIFSLLNFNNLYSNSILIWIGLTTGVFITISLIYGIIYYQSDKHFKLFIIRILSLIRKRGKV